VQNPDDLTPWEKEYCQKAYRYYYLPLNYIRNENVIQRGLQVGFFNGIQSTVDWGAGPATASLALAKTLPQNLKKQILIDQSETALKVFSDLKDHLKSPEYTSQLKLKNLNIDYQKTLLTFSYSLTEMKKLPDGFFDFDSIMILEPSTQDDGRKLSELRNELIQKGYFIWAPCTHQKNCPLLTLSKTDWCHDRFHVQAPDWFWETEKHLPFKNKTITTSYLLAKKSAPPENLKNYARTVGDSMEEKGKTRQLVCRATEREFLTWMHKQTEPQVIPRGELVQLPDEIEKKSNELRIKAMIKSGYT
jgi:ribosomal protein RSM22 (predicted rRNA methylase)